MLVWGHAGYHAIVVASVNYNFHRINVNSNEKKAQSVQIFNRQGWAVYKCSIARFEQGFEA